MQNKKKRVDKNDFFNFFFIRATTRDVILQVDFFSVSLFVGVCVENFISNHVVAVVVVVFVCM
jgi:hypothetical protein